MSELDFRQKIDLRRAFWALGASTRLDVKLSALVPLGTSRPRRPDVEEWTDLDVLAVQYAPLTGLLSAVADCKTTKSRATERVFWLRGVADLFGAQAAYLVRDGEMAPSTRQLAHRLGITALDGADRANFAGQAGEQHLPRKGGFLEPEAYLRWVNLLAGTPRTFQRVDRYRRTLYWTFPKFRNIVQLPAYLSSIAPQLDPSQAWAHALVIDFAWLYMLTVVHAVHEVGTLHLSDLGGSLRQVVVGGEHAVREKEDLRRKIQEVLRIAAGAQEAHQFDVVPPYFGDLTDLVARALRRRGLATEVLRVLEFIGVETVAAKGAAWYEAFPDHDPVAAKLASDVVLFLCRACRLDQSYASTFDAAIGGRPAAEQGEEPPGQTALAPGVGTVPPPGTGGPPPPADDKARTALPASPERGGERAYSAGPRSSSLIPCEAEGEDERDRGDAE